MAPMGGDQVYTYAPGSLPIEFPIDSLNKFGIEIPANSSIELGMHIQKELLGNWIVQKLNFIFIPKTQV